MKATAVKRMLSKNGSSAKALKRASAVGVRDPADTPKTPLAAGMALRSSGRALEIKNNLVKALT
jgi:hypothetical protein